MAPAGTAVRQLERCFTESGTSSGSTVSGDEAAPDPGGDGKAEGAVPPEKDGEEAEKPPAAGRPAAEAERICKPIGLCSSPLHRPVK